MDLSVTDFNVRLRTIRLRELILAAIIAFVVAMVIAVFLPMFEGFDEAVFAIFMILLILFFAWALRGTHGLKDNFSQIFERDNSREILYVLIINFIFALFIVSFFVTLDAFSNPLAEPISEMMEASSEYIGTGVLLLEIFTAIILAPIIEELVFRGVLFNRLKIRTGLIVAMLVSSFLFAIGHEFGGIISAFVFGMCMCIIYYKTDNILLTMTIHSLNNLIGTLLDFTPLPDFLMEMPWLIITFIISAICGILILIYIYKNLKAIRASTD